MAQILRRWDGLLGMAARCTLMARPMIENCDSDRWGSTCRRNHRQGIRCNYNEEEAAYATLWAWRGSTGKRTNHCVVLNNDGSVLLSRPVDSDETALLELIDDLVGVAAGGEVCWAADLNAGGAAMLIALPAAHGACQVFCVSSCV